MSEQHSFAELLAKVRAGDQAAAGELVRRYEPAIRRFIRARLTDQQLRRTLDTMDICQSVMGGFFARLAVGQFDLESPDQLIKLLATIASNKLNEKVRREQAIKRGGPNGHLASIDEQTLPGNLATPSRIVAGRELLDRFRAMLTDEERYLFDTRSAGRSWGELAVELGTTADALRMRWSRVVDRAAVELNWDADQE
ncbi:MAG: RNA polymerase subunit sigma-24 [Planctomycetes bacterium]|nr:RNA polymerase subunit sigma-24 [Planctomycetota bacterium]